MSPLPSLPIPEDAISESFVRSSGPGGQNVNKVATSVELRFDLAKSGLPDDVRARLGKLAGHRLTDDGFVVIHAHEHRTQLKNREAARERLAELIERAKRVPKARRKTKPTAVARERRLQSKHRRAEVKKRRARRAGED